jgi:hypothetical protein
MCSAAYDFALARIPIPDRREIPKAGLRLYRYLFRRQMDRWVDLAASGQVAQ